MASGAVSQLMGSRWQSEQIRCWMRGQPALEAEAMGRTNPTYRDALRAIEERWADFRRALRRRDQPRFDQLFEYAREHADASGLLNHQNPLLSALFSIDLEQEGRLEEHEERLAELERRISDAEPDRQQSPGEDTTGGME